MNAPERGSPVTKFVALRPKLEALTTRLASLIEDLLGQAGIEIAHMESRTKTVESFSEKIQRDGKSYEDPLSGALAKSGARRVPSLGGAEW